MIDFLNVNSALVDRHVEYVGWYVVVIADQIQQEVDFTVDFVIADQTQECEEPRVLSADEILFSPIKSNVRSID